MNRNLGTCETVLKGLTDTAQWEKRRQNNIKT